EAYNKYIAELFTLTGSSKEEAKKNAETIFKIEKQLAQAQFTREDMRDPYKTYNKFAVADFSKTTPNLNWKTLMEKMLVKGEDSLLVSNPAFFRTVDSVLISTPINDLKTYLK